LADPRSPEPNRVTETEERNGYRKIGEPGFELANSGRIRSEFPGLWPAGPGHPQHEWEEPRVVNSESTERWGPFNTDNKGWRLEEVGRSDRTDGPVRQAQPKLGRTIDGNRDRVDRLRLLGNGVVPDTVERAFRVLSDKLKILNT